MLAKHCCFLCALRFLRSSKDFTSLACLLVSRGNECTMHGRVRLEVEGIHEASVLFTWAARRSPHQAHICCLLLCRRHLIVIMESRTPWTWKTCWEIRQHANCDIKLMTVSLLCWPPPKCSILFHVQGVFLERSKGPVNI